MDVSRGNLNKIASMKNDLKSKCGLERIKKVRDEVQQSVNQNPLLKSDQEIVDEISLDIEVKNIMDEVLIKDV